ncbi:MAG: hypothetical protein J6A37_09340, partial [Oscillospiraceae bacterium]|nr:hypothetical protein [Oscillospiraceae bacterium]
YVFENVFKGDKSKYDPVKRAEEICGFQTSRISNGNMAEQFNRVLNGEIRIESKPSLNTAEDREAYIWNFLKQNLTDKNGKPISDMHLAAIMGNMYVETGGSFDPANAEDDKGWAGSHNIGYISEYDSRDDIGWGLLQWTYSSRKEGLLEFAIDKENVGDMNVQLNYILYELKEDPYLNKLYNSFLSTNDINNATNYFCDEIERAGVEHYDRRQAAAKEIYQRYAGDVSNGKKKK